MFKQKPKAPVYVYKIKRFRTKNVHDDSVIEEYFRVYLKRNKFFHNWKCLNYMGNLVNDSCSPPSYYFNLNSVEAAKESLNDFIHSQRTIYANLDYSVVDVVEEGVLPVTNSRTIPST